MDDLFLDRAPDGDVWRLLPSPTRRVTGFAMLVAELRTDASATPSQGLATP